MTNLVRQWHRNRALTLIAPPRPFPDELLPPAGTFESVSAASPALWNHWSGGSGTARWRE